MLVLPDLVKVKGLNTSVFELFTVLDFSRVFKDDELKELVSDTVDELALDAIGEISYPEGISEYVTQASLDEHST